MRRILSARLGRRPAPRRVLADSAPRIAVVMIDPEKVGMLIGPGGRVIRGIEADSGADEVSVSLPPPEGPLSQGRPIPPHVVWIMSRSGLGGNAGVQWHSCMYGQTKSCSHTTMQRFGRVEGQHSRFLLRRSWNVALPRWCGAGACG